MCASMSEEAADVRGMDGDGWGGGDTREHKE